MTMPPIQVADALKWGAEALGAGDVDSPRLDAEVFLGHILGVGRTGVLVDPARILRHEESTAFRDMIQRRKDREPVAYIIGYKEFWSLSFKVNPECLIPRPETEHLIEAVVDVADDPDASLRVLEIGTGCGAVAVCLAREFPGARIAATDMSIGALAIARVNAEAHGVADRIIFQEADLFPSGGAAFDMIVSNPPYVPTGHLLQLAPEVRDFEPLTALDGGHDGLRFLGAIAAGARDHLRNGWLVMEMGHGQAAAVVSYMEKAGFRRIDVVKDYAGVKRVVRGHWA